MNEKIKIKYDFSCLIERLRSIQFADSRDAIKDKIRVQLPRLIENIALVYLCPDSQTRDHWCWEAVANILRYNGLKNKNNKLLRPKTYYDFLWAESAFVDSPEAFDDVIKSKFKEEGIPLTKEMIEAARNHTEEFMKWLAVELSKAFVGSDKIIEKLKEE